MSVRFDSSADRLLRTVDLIDYNQPYTLMGMFYVISDTGTSQAFFNTDNDTTNHLEFIGIGGAGLPLDITQVVNGTITGGGSGPTLALSTWYHAALVRESPSILKAYLNGKLELAINATTASRVAPTRMDCGGEFSTNGSPLNGRAKNLKAWRRGLTPAEVWKESRFSEPQTRTLLYMDTPLNQGPGRLLDRSPFRRDWTASGTLTDEADPAIAVGSIGLNDAGSQSFFEAFAKGQASAAAALTTQIRMLAGALATAGASADLTASIRLAANAIGVASANADLNVGGLVAIAQGLATASAALLTQIAMGVDARGQASIVANLTTQIRMAAAAGGLASASAEIKQIFYSPHQSTILRALNETIVNRIVNQTTIN